MANPLILRSGGRDIGAADASFEQDSTDNGGFCPVIQSIIIRTDCQ